MQSDHRFIWKAEAGARRVEGPQKAESQGRSARHSCRVLVVDDDVLVRAQLCGLLHESNYEVETASSGEDALRLLRAFPCDIVVTDWKMLVMDGVTLCQRLRSLVSHGHVYVLMFTVKKSPQELLEAFAAGVDDFVVKGTSSAELLARLERGRSLANWRLTYQLNDDDTGQSTLMDTATGVYNVAYLRQHLPREMARAERYNRPLTVLTCQISGMAQVDEQLLAAAGESLMRGFASCSTECMRLGDWLVRSGLREFIIVLPETGEAGARCVARKLIKAFQRRGFTADEEALGAAIKFKVTGMEPGAHGDGAAPMRVVLEKAGSIQPGDQRLAVTATASYLSDIEAVEKAQGGRNWPGT
jgi:two-component system, cell cycle response regulator